VKALSDKEVADIFEENPYLEEKILNQTNTL